MIGIIADDLTGATDAASAMRRRGIRVALTLGVPSRESLFALENIEVVIAAHKIRSTSSRSATETVTATAAAFAEADIDLVYFKYCSTFDSTESGNIGPISDSLLTLCSKNILLHVPGYPDNARTVCHGYLFVEGQLLSESPMRHHPLNPMKDSNLRRLLIPQTPSDTTNLPFQVIRGDIRTTVEHIASFPPSPLHILCDTLDHTDIAMLSRIATHHSLRARVLVGGGAPMAAALCASLLQHEPRSSHTAPGSRTVPLLDDRRVIIAGSASQATSRQIDAFDGPKLRLTPVEIASPDACDRVHRWAQQFWKTEPVLITSNGEPPAAGDTDTARQVEVGLAAIARRLVQAGAGQMVVAGGETSGAVAAGLGIETVVVADEICTGVPWTYAAETDLWIAFKSGNFGPDDFFRSAFDSLVRCAA